jgi:hypothetical protein
MTEKKSYYSDGHCTASFAEEKDCLHYVPDGKGNCDRRYVTSPSQCSYDPLLEAELKEVGKT